MLGDPEIPSDATPKIVGLHAGEVESQARTHVDTNLVAVLEGHEVHLHQGTPAESRLVLEIDRLQRLSVAEVALAGAAGGAGSTIVGIEACLEVAPQAVAHSDIKRAGRMAGKEARAPLQ